MSFTVQHIRSTEKDRRPNPADLVDGQVAINIDDDSPGAFFRTKNDKLVKIGPCAIGSTAPSPVNWTELSVGEMWLDTSVPGVNTLRVWNGATWLTVN